MDAISQDARRDVQGVGPRVATSDAPLLKANNKAGKSSGGVPSPADGELRGSGCAAGIVGRLKALALRIMAINPSLLEEYLQAKVSKKKWEAQKAAQDALQTAARVQLLQYEAAGRYNKIVDEIFSQTPSLTARSLKLARLLLVDPQVIHAMEKTEELGGGVPWTV